MHLYAQSKNESGMQVGRELQRQGLMQGRFKLGSNRADGEGTIGTRSEPLQYKAPFTSHSGAAGSVSSLDTLICDCVCHQL